MHTDPEIFGISVEERIELCRHFMTMAETPELAREWWGHMAFWIRRRRLHRSTVEDIAAGLRT